MSVRISPCDWPVSYSGCGPCGPLTTASDADRAMYEQMATDYLWLWTGRNFGLCTVVMQPCGAQCWEGISTWNGNTVGAQPTPMIIDGLWYNVWCNTCLDGCSCGAEDSIRLPGPVDSIESVTVDGVAVDPANYRVENHKYLVNKVGLWPQCGLEVTYKQGVPVPMGGQVAAGILACEFAKALCKDSSCALPERIKNITRQGVTVTLMDDFKTLQEGSTGIWLIDSWMQSVNKAPRRSSVRSPDVKHPRVTTFGA